MRVQPVARLRGTIAIPGDKSITHRAILFNAIAQGDACIERWLDAADTRSSLAAVRALGIEVDEPTPGTLIVHGRGREGLREPSDVIDCGNSGTTIRLLTGLLTGFPFLSVLTGDASLRARPMGRVALPLNELGAEVRARAADTLPPIVVHGRAIRGGRIVTPVASAQVKSALLLAGLAAAQPTTVAEPSRSRDHTERLLAAMGAGLAINGAEVTLSPLSRDLAAADVTVPGDISTAATWIVAASIHPDADLLLTGVGVNDTRTGLLDILGAMGASIERLNERTTGGEAVADLRVRSAALRGIEVGGNVVPRAIDELPLVALAAACAQGDTTIRDAAELRVKESDRVVTTATLLRAMGVDIEERADGLVVRGGHTLRGAAVESHGDHRLAMLGAVAGLMADGETVVRGSEAVSVSYPEFWRQLQRLGALPAQ